MTSPKKNNNPICCLIKFEKHIEVISKLAIIIGVLVAIFGGYMTWQQYKLARLQNQQRIEIDDIREQKKVAIAAIKEENNPEFIRAYTRLKTIHSLIKENNFNEKNLIQLLNQLYSRTNYLENSNFVIDDINLLMVHYTNVAMLHFNDIADSKLLYDTTYQDLRTLFEILDQISKKMKINISNSYFKLLVKDFIERDWSQEKIHRKNNQDKYIKYLKHEEVIHEK